MKILKCNNDIHFENFEAYSEEESIIGSWIDGQPIYRKVMTLTIPQAHSTARFPVLQIDQLVKVNCVVKQVEGNYVNAPYYAKSDDYAQLWYSIAENRFMASCSGANWIYIVIAEYTK